ncbi:MAG: DUF3078 domain-containing protein [Carboxylicivirga sp.]|jgi:hypothetical protein|nr:DUF3078 domain-containing protein [Carboxylicivirga sp.]
MMNRNCSFTKKFYLALLLCVLFIPAKAQIHWQGVGLDWNELANSQALCRQWHKSLYANQVGSDSLRLRVSFLTKYIFRDIAKKEHLTAYLFPGLKEDHVKIFAFEPKFKMKKYPEIGYQPVNLLQKKLNNYQHLVNATHYSSSFEEVFRKRYYLTEIADDYAFNHPDKVHLSWDSIPDAPKLGEDGFLKKRSAVEGLSRLLKDHSYDTQPNLEKIKLTSGPWTLKGTENIMFSQGYVDNWVKGGENNVSLGSDLRLTANYKQEKHEWDNYIIHKVGIVSTEEERGKVNTDLIEINTKYGHKASKTWYYSFLYNFKTQFFYGYDNSSEDPISGFLAPAYMSFAVGMDYKPNSKFTLLLSPITSRLTLVADTAKFNASKYGIPDGRSSYVVNGISVVNNLSHEITKEIKISSRLDAFYQYLGKPKEGDDRQVQIDWEVIADLKINRFLSTRVLAHLRYFTNESDKIQFRENFNITFSYNF